MSSVSYEAALAAEDGFRPELFADQEGHIIDQPEALRQINVLIERRDYDTAWRYLTEGTDYAKRPHPIKVDEDPAQTAFARELLYLISTAENNNNAALVGAGGLEDAYLRVGALQPAATAAFRIGRHSWPGYDPARDHASSLEHFERGLTYLEAADERGESYGDAISVYSREVTEKLYVECLEEALRSKVSYGSTEDVKAFCLKRLEQPLNDDEYILLNQALAAAWRVSGDVAASMKTHRQLETFLVKTERYDVAAENAIHQAQASRDHLNGLYEEEYLRRAMLFVTQYASQPEATEERLAEVRAYVNSYRPKLGTPTGPES